MIYRIYSETLTGEKKVIAECHTEELAKRFITRLEEDDNKAIRDYRSPEKEIHTYGYLKIMEDSDIVQYLLG